MRIIFLPISILLIHSMPSGYVNKSSVPVAEGSGSYCEKTFWLAQDKMNQPEMRIPQGMNMGSMPNPMSKMNGGFPAMQPLSKMPPLPPLPKGMKIQPMSKMNGGFPAMQPLSKMPPLPPLPPLLKGGTMQSMPATRGNSSVPYVQYFPPTKTKQTSQ